MIVTEGVPVVAGEATKEDVDRLQKQQSQPPMDQQFIADNINFLDATKQRRKKISYDALGDESIRSDSQKTDKQDPHATIAPAEQ